MRLFLVCLGLLAAILAMVIAPNFFLEHSGTVLAISPLAVKLKKDGLSGEELKFMQDLEDRIIKIDLPEGVTKAQAETLVEEVVKKALLPYKDMEPEKLKSLQYDKIAELLDPAKGVMAILKEQGAVITAMKATPTVDHKSVRKQIEEWHTSTEVQSAIKMVGEKKRVDLPPLRIKAAITMTEAASLGGSAYLPNVQVLPGVIDLVRVQPTFWDRLAKPATRANPLVWVNKYNKQGNATFIGEGVLKPLASFELQTESSVPRKVAERMKISTEMLNDIDYLAGVITKELQYEVDTASNTAVLTGTGVAPNPKGITLYAAAYNLATITGVTAPNNSDAIRAAIAQLRSTNFNGALTAYVNPIDAAVMDLAKDVDGRYVLAPFTTANGRNIAATPVIEDNNIAVGYLLIGDMSKYHVQMYEDYNVQWGYENDDFTKNLITVIGERRFHQWVSNNETGAFIYDTFANIKTAIA